MSINKERPHLLVLPEDDANRQIANGFDVKLNSKQLQILKPTGGWGKVVEQFTNTEISKMRRFLERRILLLMDFDEQENRLDYVKEKIPSDLEHKVFVLGVWSEPEKLRRSTGKNFEDIGRMLATDCFNNTDILWTHELLSHNQAEVARMNSSVKPFLF